MQIGLVMRQSPAFLTVAVVAGAIALTSCSTQPSGPPTCPTVSMPGGVMVPDYAPRPCLVRAAATPSGTANATSKATPPTSSTIPAGKPPAAPGPANGLTKPKPMGKSGR
ncbi:hypothetical protein [Kitasatospora sp. MBT66]|uniref:hypothetical protein n=1 Tax=Kitasatospora sp. MBT66 TaxID=1444769 RepID=UPI0005BC7E88|nr:hypothetical protein [Kitasatospora sp. MBT66]